MSTSRSTSTVISSTSTWWRRAHRAAALRLVRCILEQQVRLPDRIARRAGTGRAARVAAGPGARRAGRSPPAQGVAEEDADWLEHELDAHALKLVWVPATVLADRPAKIASDTAPEEEETIANNIAALLRTAQHELIVISPYFVPGHEGIALMRELVGPRGAHPHAHQLARIDRCADRA